MRTRSWLVLAVGLAGCASDANDVSPPPLPPVPGVHTVAYDARCGDFGLGTFSFEVSPPATGTYALDGALGGTNTVSITTTDRYYVTWAASLSMDAVIVKGGSSAQLYRYDPEAQSEARVAAPMNVATGLPYVASRIEFCFDYEVAVTNKTGAKFTRTYAWSIDQSSPVDQVLLAPCEVQDVPYTVDVAVAGHTDSDRAGYGRIGIYNPAPFAATVTGVSDLFGDEPVAVDCGVELPYELPPGASLTCNYAVHGGDASYVSDLAEVTTSGEVGPGSASAVVDFADGAMTELDRCVDVRDDRAGDLGRACADTSFAYSLPIGPYHHCTTDTFVSTASFTACDTGATGSDAVSIAVTVSD